MNEMKSLRQLVSVGANDREALGAPDRPPLTFAALRAHIDATVGRLNALGLGRGDRVAIVLPNGPEMASAFIGIACGATAAPLNPGYREEEFEFYLEDLQAKALVIAAGMDSAARSVAARRNVRVLEIAHEPHQAAGTFRLVPRHDGSDTPAGHGGAAAGDDVALILHTSGTTSRPKIVPLTHANLTVSAGNIQRSLALTEHDRCMNIMPLFHIHGLVAAILASLGAGGSSYCTPGFNALKFYGWLEDARPTWYTAVPTMHQAIVQRAAANADAISRHALRFIRSCSSALPPQVMAEVEEVFAVPLIEAYAMTEAAHQMTSNPLPPAPRKPGTVGVAAGPEVALMGDQGDLLGPGAVGEVVVRGANLTPGYENNAKANAESWDQGWFRTGDQGVMDEQGYLRITGRLKEIINRGGEKVSPREVDDVLMDHEAVQQVVTFAMPHAKLGEDVAAAVVLRDGHQATEQEIRAFASQHLAAFKVPRKIVFLEQIPKGATGKLQRIGLAAKLGLSA